MKEASETEGKINKERRESEDKEARMKEIKKTKNWEEKETE